MGPEYQSSWRRGMSSIVQLPVDLIAAWCWVGVAYLVVLFGAGTSIRVAVAGVLLCFLPGYVTVAALFPWNDGEAPLQRSETRTRISIRERAALSLGLSIALIPILGIPYGIVTAGFTTFGVLNLIAGYVLVVGLAAALRRRRLPANERFVVPTREWYDEFSGAVTTGSTANRALTIALACSIVLALGAGAFAVASPAGGESHSDFHLLTADQGQYVSAGYPSDLVEGEPTVLSWGISNNEGATTEYSVVVTVERLTEEDGELVRTETAEVDRTRVEVADGERHIHDHEVSSPLVGDDLRLSYYLYRGDAPDTPTPDDAYRHLHVWIDVEPAV